MLTYIRSVYQRWRIRRAIRTVRVGFAALGFPLDCTDEELMDGCLQASRVYARLGLTTEEAATALRALAHAQPSLRS